MLLGSFSITGNYAAAIEPPNVEEWSTTEVQKLLPNGQLQHFWNGKQNIGVKTAAFLGVEPVTFVGEYKFKTTGRQQSAQQEVARFEN